MIARRSFLLGLASAFAAPAIVRAGSLMRIVRPKLAIEGLLPDWQMREIAELLSQANEMLEDFPYDAQVIQTSLPLAHWRTLRLPYDALRAANLSQPIDQYEALLS